MEPNILFISGFWFNLLSNGRLIMEKAEILTSSDVDKGLVFMFLKMSPEERLKANDNAVRAILEMRSAYQQTKDNRR